MGGVEVVGANDCADGLVCGSELSPKADYRAEGCSCSTQDWDQHIRSGAVPFPYEDGNLDHWAQTLYAQSYNDFKPCNTRVSLLTI